MAYFSPTMAAKRARRPGLSTATAERVMVRPYGGCPGAASCVVIVKEYWMRLDAHRKARLKVDALRCSPIFLRALDELGHGHYGRFRLHVESFSVHDHHGLPAVNGGLLRLAGARAAHDLGETRLGVLQLPGIGVRHASPSIAGQTRNWQVLNALSSSAARRRCAGEPIVDRLAQPLVRHGHHRDAQGARRIEGSQ